MNNKNSTTPDEKIQRNPVALNRVYLAPNLSVREQIALLKAMHTDVRALFNELYQEVPEEVRAAMLRDSTEAFLCLYAKYDEKFRRAECALKAMEEAK